MLSQKWIASTHDRSNPETRKASYCQSAEHEEQTDRYGSINILRISQSFIMLQRGSSHETESRYVPIRSTECEEDKEE